MIHMNHPICIPRPSLPSFNSSSLLPDMTPDSCRSGTAQSRRRRAIALGYFTPVDPLRKRQRPPAPGESEASRHPKPEPGAVHQGGGGNGPLPNPKDGGDVARIAESSQRRRLNQGSEREKRQKSSRATGLGAGDAASSDPYLDGKSREKNPWAGRGGAGK